VDGREKKKERLIIALLRTRRDVIIQFFLDGGSWEGSRAVRYANRIVGVKIFLQRKGKLRWKKEGQRCHDE